MATAASNACISSPRAPTCAAAADPAQRHTHIPTASSSCRRACRPDCHVQTAQLILLSRPKDPGLSGLDSDSSSMPSLVSLPQSEAPQTMEQVRTGLHNPWRTPMAVLTKHDLSITCYGKPRILGTQATCTSTWDCVLQQMLASDYGAVLKGRSGCRLDAECPNHQWMLKRMND